jgi:hypothetical protein
MKRPKKPQRVRRPGVPCPTCKHTISDVDRTASRDGAIHRTRRCCACGRTFATKESATGSTSIDTGITFLLEQLRRQFPNLPSALPSPPEGQRS